MVNRISSTSNITSDNNNLALRLTNIEGKASPKKTQPTAPPAPNPYVMKSSDPTVFRSGEDFMPMGNPSNPTGWVKVSQEINTNPKSKSNMKSSYVVTGIYGTRVFFPKKPTLLDINKYVTGKLAPYPAPSKDPKKNILIANNLAKEFAAATKSGKTGDSELMNFTVAMDVLKNALPENTAVKTKTTALIAQASASTKNINDTGENFLSTLNYYLKNNKTLTKADRAKAKIVSDSATAYIKKHKDKISPLLVRDLQEILKPMPSVIAGKIIEIPVTDYKTGITSTPSFK
jgi:hypothetical protein